MKNYSYVQLHNQNYSDVRGRSSNSNPIKYSIEARSSCKKRDRKSNSSKEGLDRFLCCIKLVNKYKSMYFCLH